MKDKLELEVMRWKNKLRMDGIMFVVDDLTSDERSVQKEIMDRVKSGN